MSLSPAVLLLDLPPAALAGIDLLAFKVTPRFRGVKNIPSGLHFVFTGSSTAFSVRHGLWIRIVKNAQSSSQQLIITQWRPDTETLDRELDEAENLRWRANIGELWHEGLSPYRQTSSNEDEHSSQTESSDWPYLTSYISDNLLSRITQGNSTSWSLTSASSAKLDLDNIPGLSASQTALHPEKELHFLPLDLKRTWHPSATGRERTEAAQDRSWALVNLITNHCSNANAMEVIGELQFCFLMVLTLNNWSCMEQWKRLLTLLFTSRKAVLQVPDLFVKAIAALRLQLGHCKDAEDGLIDLADEGGSLLRSLLLRFRQGLATLPTLDIQDVIDELDDLESYLKDEHAWQFGGSFVKSGVLELEDGEQVRMDTTAFDAEDETGEYAPLMVDLTPEQMRDLGIENAADLRAKLSEASLRDGRDSTDEDDDADEKDEACTESASAGDENEEEQDLDDMDARY